MKSLTGGRIGLITYHKEPQLTDDDRPLIDELAAVGLRGVPVRWDDAGTNWAGFDALIIRSCWDYHVRNDEFVRWLDTIERAKVPTFNPVPLVRWNMDKRYLRDLRQTGVAVPETLWIDRGGLSLAGHLTRVGWSDAIVKPAVSASATDTWRVRVGSTDTDEVRFAALLERTTVLIQRYVPEIETRGEWSLVFIGGTLSHSAIKRPRRGDFRVQKEHGGSVEPAAPPRHVVDAAEAVMAALPVAPLFARIDGVETPDGYLLMEAECIEPDLFFRFEPDSRQKLIRSLRALLA